MLLARLRALGSRSCHAHTLLLTLEALSVGFRKTGDTSSCDRASAVLLFEDAREYCEAGGMAHDSSTTTTALKKLQTKHPPARPLKAIVTDSNQRARELADRRLLRFRIVALLHKILRPEKFQDSARRLRATAPQTSASSLCVRDTLTEAVFMTACGMSSPLNVMGRYTGYAVY
jgi:hypothetical protein